MIAWEQTGWAERAWGHQVYLYLVDTETGEQFNEAPGFDHKPSNDEVKVMAETIIARILQSRIDQAADLAQVLIRKTQETKGEFMSLVSMGLIQAEDIVIELLSVLDGDSTNINPVIISGGIP